ncbi:MAG: GNAT family N-acetyltransferase [Betaproteobacteria bacterium]|nr:GNAT family N-acetyltransferase [Betaproteobacteria bacterium]
MRGWCGRGWGDMVGMGWLQFAQAEAHHAREAFDQTEPLGERAIAMTEFVGGIAMVFENAPHWMFNRVLGFGLSRPVTDADVEALVALYGNKSLDFAICLAPHARPTDVGTRLLARGFERINVRARMVRGAEPCPAHSGEPLVRRVGAEDAPLFAAVAMAGFGAPAAWEPVFRAAVSGTGNHAFVAFAAGTPVGVAIPSVHEGVGHLNTACTLPPHRRQGVHAALMTHRIREGLALGCRAFITETGLLPGTGNHSYQNMLRCGFRLACERPDYFHRHGRPSQPS